MKRSMGQACAAVGVALALALGLAVPPAGALPEGEPDAAPLVEATSEAEAEAEVASSAEADAEAEGEAAPPAALGVTVPGGATEVAADVLAWGYEQVVRLRGSRVEILDPVTRGSTLLGTFEVGASSAWPVASQLLPAPLFYGGWHMSKTVVGHSASRIAVIGGYIFVSNLKTRPEFPGSTVHVPDGSVVSKYRADGRLETQRVFEESYAVTELDGFEWNGWPYLAIGLNKGGVLVVKAWESGLPVHQALFTHWNRNPLDPPQDHKDQVTALKMATDAEGRFLLIAGFLTTDDHPALVGIDVNANVELWRREDRRRGQNPRWDWPEVASAGPFGLSGRVTVAVGWPVRGELSFVDLASGQERGKLAGGVVSVARFFSDAFGQPRIGVRRGIGSTFVSLVAKPESTGAPVLTETGVAADLEWFVPGVVPWSVQVENRSRTEIKVQSFVGSSRAEGCYLRDGLHGVTDPFPAQPVQLGKDEVAGPFVTARKTRGDGCTQGNPGVFYLQVEPAGEPEQRRVVQLRVDAHEVQIMEQIGGGRLNVELARGATRRARVVVAERHGAPTIVGAPVLEAARLTPDPTTAAPGPDLDDPWRPVHRFTVSGITWQVPGAGDLAGTTLPLPMAEGSVDGSRWETLGSVASPLTPSRQGERVAMGEAVFDWQTPTGATGYRYFRVTAGGASSDVIDVTGLAAPAPAPAGTVDNLLITGAGTPRANGLDQIPMRVSLRRKVNNLDQSLDTTTHAALYQRIYYRDATTKALITGLGDAADQAGLLMFALKPGQYPNEGLGADSNSSIGVYFSTRSFQQERSVRATFKADGSASQAKIVTTSPLRPTASALIAEGTSAGGVSVGSCAEGACVLKDPGVAPALHSLTPTTVRVQFTAGAVHGAASLPLSQRDQVPEQLTPITDAVKISGSRATLSNPNRFGTGATFTTHLVTHGELVEAMNHYVK
jgi:hypothetical protein